MDRLWKILKNIKILKINFFFHAHVEGQNNDIIQKFIIIFLDKITVGNTLYKYKIINL